MPKNRNNQSDAFIEMMRFITTLAVHGHSMIYTGAGVLLLMVYALSQYATKDPPIVISIFGGGMCGVGLLFFFLDRKKLGGDAGN